MKPTPDYSSDRYRPYIAEVKDNQLPFPPETEIRLIKLDPETLEPVEQIENAKAHGKLLGTIERGKQIELYGYRGEADRGDNTLVAYDTPVIHNFLRHIWSDTYIVVTENGAYEIRVEGVPGTNAVDGTSAGARLRCAACLMAIGEKEKTAANKNICKSGIDLL